MAFTSSRSSNIVRPASTMQSVPGTYNIASRSFNVPNNVHNSGPVIPKGYVPSSRGGATYITPNKTVTTKNSTYSTSSGGGRSSGGGGFSAPSPQSSGGGYDPYQAELDSIFGEASGFLDQLESSTRAGEADFYKAASAPYESQIPLLGQQRDQAIGANKNMQSAEQMREQNALAAARRLFNELRQGNIQRFGGGSSAAEFSSDILGREFQRNMGDIQNTAGENMRTLLGQAQDVENSYQSNLQSINTAKEGALAQARRDFQGRIDQINNTRFQLAQQKAQARLDALRELRARAYQIEDWAMAQGRNLETYRSQSLAPIQQAMTNFGQVANKQVQTTNYGNPNFSTPTGQVQGANPGDLISYFSPRKRQEELGSTMFA